MLELENDLLVGFEVGDNVGVFDVEFDEEDSVCVVDVGLEDGESVISFAGVNVGFEEVGLEIGAFVEISIVLFLFTF